MDHGIRVSTVNVSAPNCRALADFWARLLGWEVYADEDTWVLIGPPDRDPAVTRISFEHDAAYQPPVWPSAPGEPPMQLHLEVRVTDLAGATEHALGCGATLAEHQPQDDVRVCLDPAGHPFCLWLDEQADAGSS